MTTTTSTINISFYDADDDRVKAAYFQVEEGWVTFKSEDHKAIASYPESRISRIMQADL